MGTNWRSKAFHDVCYKNLKDAGFPDRIAWMQAAASTRPWMDLSRVGIYGCSAGGQSAVAALLHHGDFYKAAAADSGCHDNRMDKLWWNEQFMGYPVDESYRDSSNVYHAAKLRGALMLIVGEMDRNVEPSSTLQLVNALINADKDHDLLFIPGGSHGCGDSPYALRRQRDFFRRHLLLC
jgi:dipeptidyl aminopeptidase/acylaminoacyl peptidase